MAEDDARKIIKAYCKVDHTIDLRKFDINKITSYIKSLKEVYGISIRQIERLTGISREIIQRL